MSPWRREWQPNPVFLSGEFHGQSSLAGYSAWCHKESDIPEWLTYIHTVVKNRPANAGDLRDFVAGSIKNPPTMQETWVPPLGWEDLLEKAMAIHSSTIAWKIPWTEEPGRLQSMGSQIVGDNWATSLSFFLSSLASGNRDCSNWYHSSLFTDSCMLLWSVLWWVLKARVEGLQISGVFCLVLFSMVFCSGNSSCFELLVFPDMLL